MAGAYRKPEKVDEKRFVSYAESKGCQALKGAIQGRVGYPDRLVLLPTGRFFWMEFKRPGEEPEKIQLHIHKKLRRLGNTVYVVDNYRQAVEILKSELRA